jgi:hypothetical protein
VTSAPVAFGAIAVARAAAFEDTLRIPGTPQDTSAYVEGAYEHPGLYSLEIEQAGYQTWTRHGVRVTAGVCHVNTVRVTARLVPTT